MEQLRAHWEAIYKQRRPEEVSWYEPHLTVSLRLLANAGLRPDSRVIDVGGRASTLVDDLLEQGIHDVTVLDIAGHALAVSKARLGARADNVQWIEADVTDVQLPTAAYDIWHDRVVFHFLTHPEARRRYLDALRDALRPGGQVVMATFGLQAPPKCSGLDVMRYSPQTLQAELGSAFRLAESIEEEHRTPFNTVQPFLYCRFERT